MTRLPIYCKRGQHLTTNTQNQSRMVAVASATMRQYTYMFCGLKSSLRKKSFYITYFYEIFTYLYGIQRRTFAYLVANKP